MKLIKLLVLAFGLAVAVIVNAASSGDIIDIRPCDCTGTTVSSPVSTIADPLGAGESIYFKVCFGVSRGNEWVWMYDYVGSGSRMVEELISPLKIGVYISGRLEFAEYTGVSFNQDDNPSVQAFIFRYETKPGDFALPIRLATRDGPAGHSDKGTEYLLLNGDKWAVVKNDGSRERASFRFGTGFENIGYTPVADYTLVMAGFYVKTIDFQQPMEEADGVWRTIASGSTRTADIAIESVVTLTNATTLYVWSEDETRVKVANGVEKEMVFGYDAGNPNIRTVTVGTVKIPGGESTGNFALKAIGAEGDTASIVLSAFPGYMFDGANRRLVDYLKVDVRCSEPESANVKVAATDTTIIADGDYLEAKTRLTVSLNNFVPKVGEDVVVEIQPSFEDGTPSDCWNEYIRFSIEDSVQTLPGTELPRVTFTANSATFANLNVFALRSDEHTRGVGHQIVLTPRLAGSVSGIDDFRAGGLNITAANPVIVVPEEGFAETVLAGEFGHEVSVAVRDVFADMMSEDTGYQLKVKIGNTTRMLEDLFVRGEDGELTDADGNPPRIDIPEYSVDQDVTVQLTAVAPISGKKSETRIITYHVKVPDTVTANVELVGREPGDNEYFESTSEDPVTVSWQAKLSNKSGAATTNPHGTPVYAFLLCEGEYDLSMFGGSGNNIKCIVKDKMKADRTTVGKQLTSAGNSVSGQFQVLDGLAAGDGGMNYVFSIAFCTTSYYDPATVINNEIRPGNGIDILVYNREPTVSTVYFNGFEPEGDDRLINNQYPKNQPQMIQPEIVDAGYDLKNAFQYKWTAKRDGKVVANGVVTGDADADINEKPFVYSFPQAGHWTITLQVRDKDMPSFAKKTYTFGVDIIDTPVVKVVPEECYYETNSHAKIAVGLGFYDSDETIWVRLTVIPPEGENPGTLKLDSAYRIRPDGSTEEDTNVYYVPFTGADLTDIAIEELDGTQRTSGSKTFSLRAEVVTTSSSIVEGKTWAEYYTPCEEKIHIENVAPVTVGVTPSNGTNAWLVASSGAHAIQWGVRSDVDADMAAGIRITFTGCSNAGTITVDGTGATSGSFVPEFTTGGGETYVTMTITDKDMGSTDVTYLYFLQPRKQLVLRPFGPASTSESVYTAAAGRGKGRVCANGQLESVGGFVQRWTYAASTVQAELYAVGYGSGADPYADDGTLGGIGHDVAIDPYGGRWVSGEYYTYDGEYDNFFYRWFFLSGDTAGGRAVKSYGAVNVQVVSGQEVVSPPCILDKYEKEKSDYADCHAEAIFSRELLKEDNLGDINGDGIPDLYMSVYKFGVFDDAGELMGNDLADTFVDYDDGDYLPNATSIRSEADVGVAHTWQTGAEKFGSVQEIRGCNDVITGGISRFNDAYLILAAGVGTGRALALFADAKSEMRFTDPNTDPDSTLSYAEWIAYRTYCDERGWDPEDEKHWGLRNGGYENSWSPERPTDPCREDTDGDGFSDGFEYYLWYRAHVGEVVANDTVVRMTGRRYNLSHPMDPEVISSDVIEMAFDPLSKAGNAETRDTDNDGLTDLEEFALGTDPVDFDSDGDGLPDGYEVARLNTDPVSGFDDDIENPDHDAMAYAPMDGWTIYPIEGNGNFRYICGNGLQVTTNEVGEISEISGEVYDAWVYGGNVFVRGFKYEKPEVLVGKVIGEQFGEAYKLWVIHYDVYTVFGFDPRMGWKYDEQNFSAPAKVASYNYAHCNKAFTHLDESLVAAFYIHMNGMVERDLTLTGKNTILNFWSKWTTDPFDADTDHDGAPDGWELYDQRGGREVLDTVYGVEMVANHTPYFRTSPFNGSGCDVDVVSDSCVKGGDGLSQNSEFSGVISAAEYPDCESIALVNPEWQNKKWPTDQWNTDTDGDGLADRDEGEVFIYGDTAGAAPSLACVEGGGLNPLSWDTDGDNLPDPWEYDFTGKLTTMTAPGSTNVVVNADGTVSTNIAAVVTASVWEGGMNGSAVDFMEDYDNDGLKNWQEYMVGTMRCWRYDDTVTTWGVHNFDGSRLEDDEYFYTLLVDVTSPDYNPALRSMHCNPAIYMSACDNKWENVYGRFYYFKDGIYHDLRKDAGDRGKGFTSRWTGRTVTNKVTGVVVSWNSPRACPVKYISCDPREPDTDGDGMDDYYELFHGLNPLLGTTRDIVGESWVTVEDSSARAQSSGEMGNGKLVEAAVWNAEGNFWTFAGEDNLPLPTLGLRAKGSMFDFVQYPWLAGMATADPDGDNIRNTEESIISWSMAESTYHHSDPTPLWMTDLSYTNSLAYRYYYSENPYWTGGIPVGFTHATGEFSHVATNDTGAVVTNVYRFSDFPWLSWNENTGVVGIKYNLNAWKAFDAMFSFEQDEGYDTDGDFRSDFAEARAHSKAASDVQDFDSPVRRQAMYFGGDANPGFLQTSLPLDELSKDGVVPSTDRMLLYYTVECWVKADESDVARHGLQTIISRPIWTGPANAADEKWLRRNFLLGIRGGRWYTCFDSAGTDARQSVAVDDGPLVTSEWTHLAAAYDGQALRLYVNGICGGIQMTSVQPEHGLAASHVGPNGLDHTDTRWVVAGARALTYDTASILIGAEALTEFAVAPDLAWHFRASGVDSYVLSTGNAAKLSDYGNFFKGYVDEVRIWDGARSADEICSDVVNRKRYTRKDAIANRQLVHDELMNGAGRSPIKGNKLPAELRYLWSFDHVPGAVEAKDVVIVPGGFVTDDGTTDGMAVWARPVGWVSPWLTAIDESIRSSVYTDLAWIPWIRNTVAHLPRYDGLTRDSLYWAEGFAGGERAMRFNVEKYDFARTAEPQCNWYQMLYSDDRGVHGQDYPTFNGEAYEFAMRESRTTGNDLIPLGGVYAKRISSAEGGMWDDHGAAEAWGETGVDSDNNGFPDWWELYARQNFCMGLDPSEPIMSDTKVVYGNGAEMTAREAYLRDLSRGMLPDGQYYDDYSDTADVDHDGIPDWWEELYGIDTGSDGDKHADADNDGLSNYAEYLLSEVFDLKAGGKPLFFDPTEAFSVNPNVPDYFFRVGDIYIGEIFTDHDRIDDAWEVKYFATVTPYLYDADADPDGDGWSNYAEFQAGTDPTTTGSIGIDQVQIDEYPVPTVEISVNYEGNQDVIDAPLVVKAWHDPTLQSVPDAVWMIGQRKEATQNVDGGSNIVAGIKYIGMNPNKEILFYLSPGSIVKDSVRIEYKDVNWRLADRTTGQMWFFDSGTAVWREALTDLEISGENGKGNIVDKNTKKEVGTIDYVTGAVRLDLTAVNDQMLINGDVSGTFAAAEGMDLVSIYDLDRSYIRVKWNAKPITGGKTATYYLSDAEEPSATLNSLGHVKEGLNTFVAFYDLDGDGRYTAGEPYGAVRDIDIGWNYAKVKIELTDTSAVSARFNVQDAVNDREALYGTESGNYDTNKIVVGTVSGGKYERVRVVRTLIDGHSVSEVHMPQRVVLDKMVYIDDEQLYVTEADILKGEVFDIDWEHLADDMKASATEINRRGLQGNHIGYRVILGNEPIQGGSDVTNNLLGIVFNRAFDPEQTYREKAKPVCLGPGEVKSASPTFSWYIPNGLNTYTAFEINVYQGGSLVWNSGMQLMPARVRDNSCIRSDNRDGWRYDWTAPIYAGDKLPNGKVFGNGVGYTWQIRVTNAKFKNLENWSLAAPFMMNVPTDAQDYGSVQLAVRHYGPASIRSGATIRVQAFTTPDFCGRPVGQGYVTDVASVGSTDAITVGNASIIGLPVGSYYIRAFVDSNGDGECQRWESWGFLCARDRDTAQIYSPRAVKVGSGVGKSEVIPVYLDDGDTDGDNLPDAWESASGNLSEMGTSSLNGKLANGIAVNTALTEQIKAKGEITGGLESKVLRMLSSTEMPGLLIGASGSSPEDVVEIVRKQAMDGCTVRITGITPDAKKGVVRVKVSGEVVTRELPAMSFYSFEGVTGETCTFDLLNKRTLISAGWEKVGSVTFTVGPNTVEVEVPVGDDVDLEEGFFAVGTAK